MNNDVVLSSPALIGRTNMMMNQYLISSMLVFLQNDNDNSNIRSYIVNNMQYDGRTINDNSNIIFL